MFTQGIDKMPFDTKCNQTTLYQPGIYTELYLRSIKFNVGIYIYIYIPKLLSVKTVNLLRYTYINILYGTYAPIFYDT